MGNLTASKYIQIVPRKKDYAVYHALFGELQLMDSEGKRLLEAFKTPDSIDNVTKLFPGYDPLTVWSYIRDLRAGSFLVPEDNDEYGMIERDRKRREHYLSSGYLVRGLQLVLTNSNNFKCGYCFGDSMHDSKERSELQFSPENSQMSFETAELAMNELLALCERNGNRALNVEFFGKEPLVNRPVIEKVLNTFGSRSRGGVSISYSVTTNGYVITPRMAELFSRHGVTVTVSFDSPGSGENRPPKMGKGGKQVQKNLRLLKDSGNRVTFNSVICRETLGDYDGKNLVDVAERYDIRMIGLILDPDLDYYREEGNREKVIDELWETYRYGNSRGIPVVGYWQQLFRQIAGQQSINLLSGYKTCPAAGCKLSVEPSGDVFICKCCSERMGHISDLDSVIASAHYRNYAMRAYLNAPDCAGCEIEGFCSGVCMGSLEKKYKRLDAIEKTTCKIYRGITRKLLENVGQEEVKLNYLSTHQQGGVQHG